MAIDVKCNRSLFQVDVQENVYGDGFGWKFLIDATLTATRIRDPSVQKVHNKNSMLVGQYNSTEAKYRQIRVLGAPPGVSEPQISPTVW